LPVAPSRSRADAEADRADLGQRAGGQRGIASITAIVTAITSLSFIFIRLLNTT